MAKAKKEKSILVTAKNAVGVMADISATLAGAGVNLQAVCGWEEGDQGKIMLIADDNNKAAGTLKSKNYKTEMVDVVLIDVPHKVGSLKEVTDKIKAAGVNLKFIYASASPGASSCMIIASGSDNDKIASLV